MKKVAAIVSESSEMCLEGFFKVDDNTVMSIFIQNYPNGVDLRVIKKPEMKVGLVSSLAIDNDYLLEKLNAENWAEWHEEMYSKLPNIYELDQTVIDKDKAQKIAEEVGTAFDIIETTDKKGILKIRNLEVFIDVSRQLEYEGRDPIYLVEGDM